MSEFPNKVNQALLDNDNESLIHLINKSVNDETSLRIFLQLVFQFIVRNKRLIDDNPPIDHPIVFLNSIKNVLSLRRNDPSTRLLIYLIEYVLNLESKKSELQWATVSDKELNQPAFVMDFSKALENSEKEKALFEASKLVKLSDNKFYLMDVLLESALYCQDELIYDGFAFHRAAAFSGNDFADQFLLHFLEVLMNHQITGKKFSEVEDFDIHEIASSILKTNDLKSVLMYATLERIWNLESVKKKDLRSAILYKLLEVYETFHVNSNGKFEHTKRSHNIIDAFTSGDKNILSSVIQQKQEESNRNWAVELAEYWLSENKDIIPSQFVMLDAIQHLCHVLHPEQLRELSSLLLNIQKEVQ